MIRTTLKTTKISNNNNNNNTNHDTNIIAINNYDNNENNNHDTNIIAFNNHKNNNNNDDKNNDKNNNNDDNKLNNIVCGNNNRASTCKQQIRFLTLSHIAIVNKPPPCYCNTTIEYPIQEIKDLSKIIACLLKITSSSQFISHGHQGTGFNLRRSLNLIF